MTSPKIKFKRSAVASKRPSLANLELGEVALNTYDGKLFVRRDTSGVGIATTVSTVNPWTENYGSSGISYGGNISVTGVSTFSSNIDLNASIDVSGNITGSGDLTLTDTDTGSSAGPELKLYRNSSSPADADYLGQIKFAGESDTGVERNYAKITGKISDASNGTEDGIIEIAHIKAGSQNISARFKSTELMLLNGTDFSVAGDSTFTGNILAASDSTVDIGTNSTRFANGYFDTLYGDGSNLTNLPNSGYWVQTDVGINTSSNVGIGTTNPVAKLEVNVGSAVTALDIQGSAGQLFSVTNNLTSGSIFSVNDVSGIPSIDVDADGTIQLAPFGSGEYVGIGTTTPSSKLHVVGDTLVSGVSTFQSNVHLLDDDKLQIGGSVGTVDGLEIYHDGSNSYISDTGTGNLVLGGGGHIELQNASLNEYYARFISNGGVELYFNNSKKLEITTNGVTITGRVDPAADSTHDLGTTSVRWRNVYADTLYGDGSNLTNVGGASSISDLSDATTNSSGTTIGLGESALTNDDGTDNGNTALGYQAGLDITSGSTNVLLGYTAGRDVTTANGNIAIGDVLNNSGGVTGNYNVAISGFNAGQKLTSGNNNVFIGSRCGENITSGASNVILGDNAGRGSANTGSVFIGRSAGQSNDSSYSIGIGYRAGNQTASGNKYNIHIGNDAGYNAGGSEDYAVSIGYEAGRQTNNDAGYNVLVGYKAGYYAASENNICIGRDAGNSGNSSLTLSGGNCTLIGNDAGTILVEGSNVTCIGSSAEPSSRYASNEITLGNAGITTFRIPGIGITFGDNSSPTDGHVLTYSSSTGLVTLAAASGGISNVVEDTTPQLGGNLDLNSNNITGTGNIDITGTLDVSSTATFGADADDAVIYGTTKILRMGGSSGFQIQEAGSSASITQGTGALNFYYDSGNQYKWAVFNNAGSVDLYHANNKKFETTSSGAIVTGIVTATSYSDTTYTLTGTDIDPANGGIQTKVASTNTTFTESLSAGDSVVLHLEGGSSYTITWPTITWVTSSGNSAPTLTAKDVVVLWKISTTLYGAYAGSYAS